MALTAAQRNENLKFIAAASVAAEAATGVAAELSTAQAILESGWLENAPGNNPFGIKLYEGAPGRQLIDTTEWFTDAEVRQFLALGDRRTATIALKGGVPQRAGARVKYKVQDWFAKFDSLSQAFEKHAQMLLTGASYRAATKAYQKDKDLPAYIAAVAKKYATSPIYAQQLTELIAQANVQAALKAARKAAAPAKASQVPS